MVRKVALFLLAIAAIISQGATRTQAQSVMTRHVHETVWSGEAQILGRLPQDQVMQLDLVLPIRDEAGLDAFLQSVYDPTSASYRHFLSVAEFTARFGPTQSDYDSAVRFAQFRGFTVVGGSRDGMDVQIRGTVATVESAFHVNMRTYQHPTENRSFFATDSEPVTSLPFALWHITGLDNFSAPKPLFSKKDAVTATASSANTGAVVSEATTGSGPSASYLGSDMRAAYYGGTSLTGAGQNLGLWEYVGTDLADLTTYFSNAKQTNKVPITLLSADGTSTSCLESQKCDDTEQTLDMTQALGMAPGLASLTMYIGSSDTAIASAMTSHSPLPMTIGCSWGWTPVDPTALDPYFKKMAAQGQTFLTASGDSSTWSAKNEAWPADDPYVVAVGGTDLVTASAGGAWKSETAWANSGGGITPDGIAIPSWQLPSGIINSTNKGSTTLRNGPDVSANANFTFYVCADQTTCTANSYGGTSFAAPMWAGYLALVNQQLASSGAPGIGFINPIIYAQNLTSAYTTDFHDITSGTSGSYSATTGYDLVTGWGSPNGTGLINALVAASTSPTFTLTAAPVTVSVVQGKSGTSTITTSVLHGFGSAVGLQASGQPSGVTVSFSPASIASPGSGSSTMTLAVGSAVAAGTYAITVTGTGGGVTQTATVSLTVTGPPNFTLAAAPTTVSVAQGSSGTSTVTTTVTGGFSSAVALSATGQPSGVTVSFSPASIAAPGSGNSTMTIAVTSAVAVGTYTVTVTGTGGGVTSTSKVLLTVTAPPNFTLSASPTSVSIMQGGSGSTTVTTTGNTSFNSTVSLSTSGAPSGVTLSFSPASIAAPGTGTSKLTMSVGSAVAVGTYAITVTAVGGGLTNTAKVSLIVTAAPNFTLAASPTSVTVVQGGFGNSTMTTAVSNGFNSAVGMSVSGQPGGITVSFSPSSIAAPGSGTSKMTVSASATAPVGTYALTITGTGGGVTKTATVSVTVAAPPGFTLAAGPTSLSLIQGSSGSSTITTTTVGGFSSAVALTASGQPAGVTVSFSPTSIAAPGVGTSKMTIIAGATAAVGNYTLTITGTGGGVTKTATFTLGVTVPPSFTISAGPAPLAVTRGSSGISTITTAIAGGFNSAIALSATGQPGGVTVGFSPTSIAAPGAGTSKLTATVTSKALVGTYTITVSGTGGGITKTTTVTLTVK